ncbi:NACHT domain-containing NTPase [Acaryochloris marina]|uniref:NACHT domain-containing protein n=1 Tax=Acaryochloris marina TaxID=155978 RepID=UPI001BB05D11|nr:NACHT domain-containing protein [Acaryochloris marina]
MMFVTLLSTSPSLAQQYSLEQISVIKKIEETATLHYQAQLKVDKGLELALDEYRDEALKAHLNEIIVQSFYIEKIASLNKTKPWQQWTPFNLSVAIAIGILTWFRDAIIKKGNQASQGIIDNIYKRFSGTKLLRNFALEQYRKALSNKYQELKIPFRPNRPLKMAEVYVPLQLLEQGEPIDAKRAVKNFKRLMIVGQPGSGKTMLLRSLALSYANGPWDIPQQPVVIILELNRLSNTKLTIEQQLVKALERDDFPNGTNFVFQGLKQGMIMLLFDGLDEVNSADRPNVVRRLQDFISQYDQCRLAITCRTQVYKREFNTQVDQTVEVVEFDDQQIRKFMRPWEQDQSDDKSVEQLLKTLQDRPRIMELARNPLMLTIIAYLFTDTAFVLPHSRAEFYQKATDILLEVWDQACQTPNRYKGRDKKLVLRHLALYAQDQTKGKQRDRRNLTWLTVNEQVASILPGLNLKAEDDLDPILEEICERSGLLMPIDGGEGYQFTHLTLQEFFAATQLIDDVESLIKHFSKDPDVWRETVKLWCGLAGDSTRLIRAVYKKDDVTAFSCLADTQKIEPKLATDIIDHFKNWLRSNRSIREYLGLDTVSSDSIIKAFGAVAADQRPRGKDIFDFLVLTLSRGNRSTTYAAQALAATNVPKAAQVLADHYLQLTDIQTQLVRMGDVAVPKLQVIAEGGDTSAITNLGEIGTPFASRTLVPLLWDNREAIAFHAAVQLSALLPEVDIEKDLANFPKKKLPSSSQTWQGIWNPFDEVKKSAISVIAEQITDQLVQGIQTQHLNQIDLPDLDPRIVLPICLLTNQSLCKPSKDWIDTAQAILENTRQGTQLETKSPQLIREALKQQPQSLQWETLLKTLPLRMQLDVLYRLSVNRSPTKNDWQNLYTTMTYDLRASWHYQLVVSIAVLLSVFTLIGAFENSIHSSELLIRGTSTLSAFFIVPVAWLAILSGTEEPFEPNLFISLGLLGPISFCREYGRFLRSQIVWNGAQAIFDTITNAENLGCAVVVTVAGGVVGGVASAGVDAVVGAVVGAVAIASVFAGAVAVAGVFAGANADTIVSAVVSVVSVPVFLVVFGAVVGADTVADVGGVVGGVAIAGGVVGGVAGAGIGFWVKQTTKSKFGRCL